MPGRNPCPANAGAKSLPRECRGEIPTTSPLYDLDRLYSRRYVRDLLALHDIHLKKTLGQSFLVDRHGVDKVIQAARLTPDDVVLEIGPGIGHLTYQLLQKVKHVVAVEIDERFLPILKGLFGGYSNLTLVHADILKVDLARRFAELGTTPGKVVANVPYYITTPILSHLVASSVPFTDTTFTIQKDVANRYVARPGTKTYGSISVVLRYWGDARICAGLPARCFFPRPKVDSSVLHVSMHKTRPVGVANEKLFYRVIRTAFNQRRKMLRNALQPLEEEGYAVGPAFASAGIDDTRRAEQLALEDFARLADALIEETASL